MDLSDDTLDQALNQGTYLQDLIQSYQNDTCLQRYTLTLSHLVRSYKALVLYVLNDTFSL